MAKIIKIGAIVAITTVAFIIGRQSAPIEKTVFEMPKKCNLSNSQEWEYINSFLSDVQDWNADENEMSILTSDGYELYINKTADLY